LYNPRVALLPIGGHYTMGPREAVEAAKLIKPEEVIPMHYASFPVLEKDPERFIQLMKQEAPEIKVIALKPGEIHRIEGVN
ncbi:MAG: metal-dependent hydrolase, partial [Thermoplasmata archaeon]